MKFPTRRLQFAAILAWTALAIITAIGIAIPTAGFARAALRSSPTHVAIIAAIWLMGLGWIRLGFPRINAAVAALTAERDNLSSVFNSTPMPMLLYDDQMEAVRVNAAFRDYCADCDTLPDLRPGTFLRCINALSEPRGCGNSPACTSCTLQSALREISRSGLPAHGEVCVQRAGGNGGTTEAWFLYGVEAVALEGRNHALTSFMDITERKRREKESALLDFALDQVNEAVYLIDGNDRFLHVNLEACRALGYRREEFTGGMGAQDIAPYWPQERCPPVGEGEAFTYETVHRTKQGYDFPVEVTSSSFAYGGRSYKIALVRDISERRRNEELEKIRSRVFEKLARGVEMSEILVPVAEYVERARPGFLCSILLSDETGKQLFHGAAPSLPYEYVRAIDGVEIGEGVGSCGTAAWRGEPVIVEDISVHPYWKEYKDTALKAGLNSCWSEPLIGSSGRVLGTFAIYQRRTGLPSPSDLTLIDQMRHLIIIGIEREREEALRRARAEEFRALVENSPDGIVRYDAFCRRVYVNPALERIAGQSADLLIGRIPTEAPVGSMEVARQVNAAVEQVLEQGEELEIELSWKEPAGEIRHFQVRFAPELDGDGAVASVLSVTRDVTSLRKTEAQLRHAQKMESLGTLAGGVAHDINNLLTVVAGYSELLRISLAGDEEKLTYLREITASVERGAELTGSLLAFSGRHEQQKQCDDLNQILSKLQKSMSRLLRSDITLNFELCDRPLPMLVDRGQIEQVVMNLIVNARDAIASGGSIQVATALAELQEEVVIGGAPLSPGRYGVITVADDGSGMSRETVEKIFEPFFTTKETGKGTGLGLYIVFGIVGNHDGRIAVETAPGEGAVFSVYLPIIEENMEPSHAFQTESMALYGNETVLLVDDEPHVLKMTRELLLRYGYAVLTARDGVEALEVFEAHRDEIQMAVVDLIMPRRNGRVFIELIRQQKPELPVILTSGHIEDLIDLSVIDGLGIVFLEKPVHHRKLAAAIRSGLDRRRACPPVAA